MKKITSIMLTALLAVMVIAAGSSCVREDDPEPQELVKPGDRLPWFSVRMHDGSTVTPATLLGREAMIVFFNTGCSDCREELPKVQLLHEERPDLTIVCIARAEDEESIAAYWKSAGLTLPYSAQSDAAVYHLFASSWIPRIYMVDASGTVTLAGVALP